MFTWRHDFRNVRITFVLHDSVMSTKRMTRDLARKMSLAEQHEWFQQQRSRRSVLKGGAAATGALLAGPKLLGSDAGSALASSRKYAPVNVLKSSRSIYNGSTIVPFGLPISFCAQPTSRTNNALQ